MPTDLDITAAIGQTHSFSAKFKGKVEINAPIEGKPGLVLGGEGGQAQVTLADDGSWKECKLTMQQAQVGRAPDYLFAAGELKVSAERPVDPPTDVKTAGLTLSGEGQRRDAARGDAAILRPEDEASGNQSARHGRGAGFPP